MKNFTFKINRPKGKYRSFSSATMDILFNKQHVGVVYQNKDMPDYYTIHFQVFKENILEDVNPNYPWKWIKIKKQCSSFDETKIWLKQNFDLINKSLKIYHE